MACTGLLIPSLTGKMRLKFMTLPHEEGVEVDVQMCDDNFIPSTRIALFIDPRDEETYHKDLRKEANEKEQFVSSESTDPHWNIGYVEETEDESEA